MRNKAPERSAPRSFVPSRRTGAAATALAAIMSMTAASSAYAQSAAAGFIVVQKVGGGGSSVDKTARASADAATKAVEAALRRLEATDASVAAALKIATAAADAARAAAEKSAEHEGRLAALESGRRPRPSPRPADHKSTDAPKGDESGSSDTARGPGTRPPPADAAPPVGDTTGTTEGDSSSDSDAPPPPPEPRRPTPEEIVAAKAIIEARAAVAEAKAEQARLDDIAKKAQVKLLEAQHKKAEAMAELARALAEEKAAKLAEAQAQADAAKARSNGLDAAAKATRDNLADAQRQAAEAQAKLAAANGDAAKAKALLAAYNGATFSGGGLTPPTRPTTYTPANYGDDGDPRPQFFAEIIPHAGMNSSNDFRGGVEAAAFARVGEHVAIGVRGGVGGGNRMIRMGESQTVPGSSSDTGVMGAVQLGTVGGEDGANVEVGLGMTRESMTGVANGGDGSRREGAVSYSPVLQATPAWYTLISPKIRLKVGFILNLIGGRPAQLGATERENAIGMGIGIGLSTK